MTLRSLLLTLPFLAACTTATDDTAGDDAERGSVGKADAVGTCELPNGKKLCNHHGKGNCWCDEACVDYGDCCPDADDVCGIEQPEPEPEDGCGGLLGLGCNEGEFCMYTPDQTCGAADQLGECLDIPEICPLIFNPVCGCDGETYSNSCFAHGAGTSVASQGECEQPMPQFCGGIAGFACPDGQICVDDPDDDCDPNAGGADCGGICVETPEPEPCHVAGCNAELCVGPDGPEFSICIALPWTTCLNLTSCGNNADDGSCGWEQTPEFLECMASFGQG